MLLAPTDVIWRQLMLTYTPGRAPSSIIGISKRSCPKCSNTYTHYSIRLIVRAQVVIGAGGVMTDWTGQPLTLQRKKVPSPTSKFE